MGEIIGNIINILLKIIAVPFAIVGFFCFIFCIADFCNLIRDGIRESEEHEKLIHDDSIDKSN